MMVVSSDYAPYEKLVDATYDYLQSNRSNLFLNKLEESVAPHLPEHLRDPEGLRTFITQRFACGKICNDCSGKLASGAQHVGRGGGEGSQLMLGDEEEYYHDEEEEEEGEEYGVNDEEYKPACGDDGLLVTGDGSVVGGVQCDVCEKVFLNDAALGEHMFIHGDAKPFACHLCDRRFWIKDSLDKHVASHAKDKPYGCELCELRFTQKMHLRLHMRTHTGEKPYVCQVCDMRFAQSSNLQQHMFVHSTDKKHECNICQMRFSQSSNLKKHMRRHDGDRPYKCEICQKCFSQSSNLRSHIRVHSGERPYPCDFCEKRFSQSSHLKLHRRLHTGEKPYGCTVCDAAFAQSSNLHKHIRSAHPDQQPYVMDVSGRVAHSMVSGGGNGVTHTCGLCLLQFPSDSHLRQHIHEHKKMTTAVSGPSGGGAGGSGWYSAELVETPAAETETELASPLTDHQSVGTPSQQQQQPPPPPLHHHQQQPPPPPQQQQQQINQQPSQPQQHSQGNQLSHSGTPDATSPISSSSTSGGGQTMPMLGEMNGPAGRNQIVQQQPGGVGVETHIPSTVAASSTPLPPHVSAPVTNPPHSHHISMYSVPDAHMAAPAGHAANQAAVASSAATFMPRPGRMPPIPPAAWNMLANRQGDPHHINPVPDNMEQHFNEIVRMFYGHPTASQTQ